MFRKEFDLIAYEPPFPQRKFPLGMLWHQRLTKDVGLLWVKNTLAEVAAEIEAPRTA